MHISGARLTRRVSETNLVLQECKQMCLHLRRNSCGVIAFLPQEDERQVMRIKKKNYERSEKREIITITLPSNDDDDALTARSFRFAGAHEAVSKCTDERARENIPAFTLRCSANTLNLLACTFTGSDR